MIDIAEFEASGVPRVQGGTFPAQIWKAFTDAALDATPAGDWVSPPPPARPNERLVLPGIECRFAGSTDNPDQIDPQEPITAVDVLSEIVPCE